MHCLVTEDLYHVLKCKLWCMGQKLCGAGSIKRSKVIEEWKSKDCDWEMSINCVDENKTLSKQLSLNEAKLHKVIQKQEETLNELEATKKKLKEMQNFQGQLLKSNKKMSYALQWLVKIVNQKESDKIFQRCHDNKDGLESTRCILI